MSNFLIAAIVFIGGFFALNNFIYNEKQGEDGSQKNYKDVAYIIDGNEILLKNGLAETESAPGSASKIVTRYFGNEAEGDLNGDGISDIAFLLTQSTGGSGTFFYAVASIKTDKGYWGTHAVFVGDRISPQTTEIRDGKLIVNYAERARGEPMTTEPSIGKSLWFKLDSATMQFGEVVQNFEGEADPRRMTLGMKTWLWQKAIFSDGREVVPKQEGKFAITFTDSEGFSATTDCNSIGGNYSVTRGAITFGTIVSTKMYCEGSQEAEFARLLTDSARYHFTPKGELVLDLKFDSGSVIFR